MKKLMLSAFLFAGCVTSPQQGGGAGQQGMVFSSCGPADGPAVSIYLTDSAATCGKLPAAYRNARIDGTWMANVKVGDSSDYRDLALFDCDPSGCQASSEKLNVKFTDTTATTASGTYAITSGGYVKSSGKLELKYCHLAVACL